MMDALDGMNRKLFVATSLTKRGADFITLLEMLAQPIRSPA
jgi:hypothetical protein